MITTQRLIEQADFPQYADLSQYLQPQYVNVHIIPTQEMHIRPLLGDALYDELIAQVEGGYPDPEYQTLHDYVKPILAYKVSCAYITTAGIYSTNSGLRELTSEDSTPASARRVQALADIYNDRAALYIAALVKFLDENKTTYPLYTGTCAPQNNGQIQISAITKKNAAYWRGRYNSWGILN